MTTKMLKNWFKKLIQPQNTNEDLRRRELILNILLGLSIISFMVLNIIRAIDVFSNPDDRGLPVMYTLLILAFFIFLLWLSKKGKIKTASWLLITVYSLPMFYCFIFWGADLPAALLLTVLIITLFGILIGARSVLISTAVINAFLIILTYLQTDEIIKVNNYWRNEKHELGDAIAYAVLFLIIAGITWLFCLEIKRALKRARQSEAELRQERDLLEIKVIARTNELRRAEAEKINQLYRLAEFGRLSSGIFHDLINPLTAVSLNLEQIKGETENKILNAKSYLSQALLATRKMENLIAGIKKQIQRESNPTYFLINEEINQVIQILAYKTRRANTRINFLATGEVKLYGDAVKFGQIISNLLANAIEASEGGNENDKIEKIITIKLGLQENNVIMSVSDRGTGIASENLPKIFEPFFSTKKEAGRGLGLGLASAKNITEKDFSGTIAATSQPGQGTEFIVTLPFKK